jgi:quinol monooxygenase YgiN
MIHVVAIIEIAEGQREAYLAAFRENVPNVLAEEGCLEYAATVDLETDIAAQPPGRDNVVTVIEKWKDLDALKAHLAAPHMIEYRTKVKDLVRCATLYVLEPASGIRGTA